MTQQTNLKQLIKQEARTYKVTAHGIIGYKILIQEAELTEDDVPLEIKKIILDLFHEVLRGYYLNRKNKIMHHLIIKHLAPFYLNPAINPNYVFHNHIVVHAEGFHKIRLSNLFHGNIERAGFIHEETRVQKSVYYYEKEPGAKPQKLTCLTYSPGFYYHESYPLNCYTFHWLLKIRNYRKQQHIRAKTYYNIVQQNRSKYQAMNLYRP